MSLAQFLPHVDRAVNGANRAFTGASSYMFKLVDKFTAVEVVVEPRERPSPESSVGAEGFAELPADLLRCVFSHLDVDTLSVTVPLVCKAWKAEASEVTRRDRLSSKLAEQIVTLVDLGAPVSAAHLHLAMRGRNFLRNPAFRRDCNTQLLEIGRPNRNKWTRNAWVLNHVTEHGVGWETRAEGFTLREGCGLDAPPAAVPYGGGGMRLGERMQQHLQGFTAGLLSGLAGGGGAAATAGSLQQAEAAEATMVAEPPSCLASTADWCEVMQVVDLHWELQRRGLSAAQAAHLLDAGLALRLSVHVGSRADCLGQFCVGLMLDEGPGAAGGEAVPHMESFVARPNRHSYFSGRVRCGGVDRWQRFEYTVPACPRGFRRVLVLLRGRRAHTPDSPPLPLPVHCGAKFACAELVFE